QDLDHAAVGFRARGPDLQDLGLDPQAIPRPGRARPGDLAAQPDEAAGDLGPAVHQETHGYGRRVPAARRQRTEHGAAGTFLTQVKGLGVEGPGKVGYFLRGHDFGPAGEALADLEVFEVQRFGHARLFLFTGMREILPRLQRPMSTGDRPS